METVLEKLNKFLHENGKDISHLKYILDDSKRSWNLDCFLKTAKEVAICYDLDSDLVFLNNLCLFGDDFKVTMTYLSSYSDLESECECELLLSFSPFNVKPLTLKEPKISSYLLNKYNENCTRNSSCLVQGSELADELAEIIFD